MHQVTGARQVPQITLSDQAFARGDQSGISLDQPVMVSHRLAEPVPGAGQCASALARACTKGNKKSCMRFFT